MSDIESGVVSKLSRKVVELSIAVHQLFKSKHIAEQALEITKKDFIAFSMTKENALQEKINVLESQLSLKESKNYYARKLEDENKILKGKIEFLENQIKQIQGLMKLKDESLDIYRTENQSHKIQITRLKKDINTMENSDSNFEINNLNKLIKELTEQHENELEMCAFTNKKLEDKINSMEQKNIQRLQESFIKIDNLEKQCYLLQQEKEEMEIKFVESKQKFDKTDQQRKRLLADNRLLDISKKKLNSQMQSLQHEFAKLNKAPTARSDGEHINVYCDQGEEMTQLRQQLHMYRLELANREENFTRIFVQKPLSKYTGEVFNLSGMKKMNENTRCRTSLPYLQDYKR